MNYYNEFDPCAAAWLRELIAQKLIPAGVVDERSITDVHPNDLLGFVQCHFFAGIGGWPLALQLAGWPEDRPVWTGSCPCQPFSSAGNQLGTADERHLWPVFLRLIRECRPPIVFGEQVASPAVVGTFSKNQRVQEVLDREAVFEVLREFQGQSPMEMQGLRTIIGAGPKEIRSRENGEGVQALAHGETRPRSCECSEEPSQDEGDGIRPLPDGYSVTGGSWNLRGDGNPIRSENTKFVERPIPGSDRLIQGLHQGQHESDPLCTECGCEHLGLESSGGNGGGNTGEEDAGVERLIRSIGRCTTEEIGKCWLSGISDDLDAEGYSVGSCVLGAHSIGAPHIRQRLFWVADSGHQSARWPARSGQEESGGALGQPAGCCAFGGLGDTNDTRSQGNDRHGDYRNQPGRINAQPIGSTWKASRFVECRDGKSRRVPVEREIQPLADGLPYKLARRGSIRPALLKGAGNAIVPQVAAEFLMAFMEAREEVSR